MEEDKELTFGGKWKYMCLVDECAELIHVSFLEVYKLNVVEWLTYVCYSRDKNRFKQEAIDKMRRIKKH